jgi:hypothetical protein
MPFPSGPPRARSDRVAPVRSRYRRRGRISPLLTSIMRLFGNGSAAGAPRGRGHRRSTWRPWAAAAAFGIVLALAVEALARPTLGHRAAHALGYGVGVAAFHALRLHLRPAAERPPRRRVVAESAALGLAIFAASWLAGGLTDR